MRKQTSNQWSIPSRANISPGRPGKKVKISRVAWAGAFASVYLALGPIGANAATTIDASHQYSYGANIGWMNWLADSSADGVSISEFICSGWIYGANVGWINFGNGSPVNHIQYQNNSAVDFGVNYGIDPTQPGFGILRGYAYGANIGWINFEATGNPRIRFSDGALEGYAYSANCGWINLGDPTEHNLVTDHIAMGVDSNGNGIADAWEYLYYGGLLAPGGQNSDPFGTGETNLQHYLDGTNPTLADSRLRITNYVRTPNPPNQNSQITWKSTTARLYLIETNTSPDMSLLSWIDSGLGTFAPDAGTSTTRTATLPTVTKRFFRVRAFRPLP